MKKRPIGLYLLAGVVSSIFVFGIVRLFILRYEAGDMYPPYSSLRVDPLGAKAIYEGLDRLDGFSCSRNYLPFTQLTELRQTTIFYLGISAAQFQYAADKDSVIAAEQMLANGGRLVVSFFPVAQRSKITRPAEDDEQENTDDDAQKTPDEDAESEQQEEPGDKEPTNETVIDKKDELSINLAERWGVTFDVAELPEISKKKDNVPVFVHRADRQETRLPDKLSWHTGLYFTPTNDAWRVIYRRGAYPVVIERDYGNGTIVLSADSYFLSNEAMRNERHADLLAWLVGGNSHVMFDETHFGVMQSPGVSSLIRKYGLTGFFASLFVLALLFVWKNSASFVPQPEERFAEGGALGKDMMAGLVNLLRSNIAPHDILPACVAEWEKTFAHLQKDDPTIWAQIAAAIRTEEARPSKERQPMKLYRTISRILAEK